MDNKNVKKIITIIVILLTLFISNIYIENINADSGWDTDYDSGSSSWDSDDDYDYDYDDDYDYDYDDDDDDDDDYDYDYSGSSSSSSGSSCTTDECRRENILSMISFLVLVIILICIRKIINKGLNKVQKTVMNSLGISSKPKHELLTEKQIYSVIPNFDIEGFKTKAYQIFYDTQIAWMNFDYDKLKELLTDELYNMYVTELDALKLKNQRNVMKNFNLNDCYLYNLSEENDKFIAKIQLSVSFYDYIEDIKTGKVLRGNKNKKYHNTYLLTFVRSKENATKVNKCPRCGAPVEGNSTGVCEYCKSKLINETHDWVMSKKEKTSQN